MVAAQGSLIAFGIVIACYYNIGMYYASGPVVWRAPIASQLIFIIAQAGLVIVLPESPRWLARRAYSKQLALDSGPSNTPKQMVAITKPLIFWHS